MTRVISWPGKAEEASTWPWGTSKQAAFEQEYAALQDVGVVPITHVGSADLDDDILPYGKSNEDLLAIARQVRQGFSAHLIDD